MNADVLGKLKRALVQCDAEEGKKWAKKAVEEKIDLINALDAVTKAMRGVGDAFGRGELFLPELMGTAEAMKSAMSVIQSEIRETEKFETVGIVVLGTVYGDIHNIGKNLVSTFLTTEGFEVIDLGINVTSERFVEAVRRHQADILAMSSLMTTTAPMQKKIIEVLEKEKLRDGVKVMVGGGAITEEFARSIGADGYGATAPEAPHIAKKLVGIQ